MMRRDLLALAGLIALGALPAGAHEGELHPGLNDLRKAILPMPTKADPVQEARARAYFTDLPVVTQHGQELRFYSDVLKDRVVAVTLFYTECTGMCPISNAKLAEVQDILGEQFGRDFFFVSVSLDPETDTPEVLKDYAAKFGAREGWMFLTGKKDNLKQITYKLGQTDPRIETHNPFFMLGNVGKAHWTKVRPNEPAKAIAERLRSIAGMPLGN
ncbi:MAG: SCO family protein [Rhodospirillales bacterium]|nr:SCO family protein [Rhodospirillales bacterium]